MNGNYNSSKIRCVLHYHGGKGNMSRRIADLFPDHEIYLEPFVGAANVLLNKFRSHVEVICDLNEELIHFYHFFRDNLNLFLSEIKKISYSKECFLEVKAKKVETLTSLERAVRFFVLQNQSLGALGQDYSHTEGDIKQKAWDNYQIDLPKAADRLQGVEIRLQSAFEIIDEFSDDHRVLTYLDPPYYPSTRISPNSYKHELTAFEHLKLLKKIKEFRGKVIISGYANPTYDQELADWDRIVIPRKNQSSHQEDKPWTEEILWIKPYWPF